MNVPRDEADPVAAAPGGRDVVRVRAANPGPMTLTGTNTYVVGSSPAWVIDPGPADPGHIDRVRSVAEERGGIGGVVLTHSHLDHNEGVEMLGAPLAFGNADGVDEIEALLGRGRKADSGQITGGVVGPFTVLPTPGHAADHVALIHGDVCFCGDLMLGEGSSIVPPASGGGSMVDYMRSLELIAELDPALVCPGHGPWIEDPRAKIAEYTHHRQERERLLLAALDLGVRSIEELLDAAWSDVPEAMRPAAALALQAHLEKLWAEDRAPRDLGP